MVKKRERDINMDLLRIFSCFCIIGLHVSGQIENPLLWRSIQAFVRPALWVFMALSGYYILSRPINKWREFWFKHITGLVIPFIIYVYLYHVYYDKTFLHYDIIGLLKGDPIGHLWYVYTLIVLYIISPFLQKMLNALNQKQIVCLLFIMLFTSRSIDIYTALGKEFGFPVALITDCSLFFLILGYYLHEYPIKNKKIIFILGILNIFLCIYALSNSILVNHICELSVVMTIGVIFYFTVFKCINGWNISSKLKKVIGFISGRTYGIYLIHILILQIINEKQIWLLEGKVGRQIWYFLIRCLAIFVVGGVCATILDLTICKALKNILFKVYDKSIQLVEERKSWLCKREL